jgi:hypothetical protein
MKIFHLLSNTNKKHEQSVVHGACEHLATCSESGLKSGGQILLPISAWVGVQYIPSLWSHSKVQMELSAFSHQAAQHWHSCALVCKMVFALYALLKYVEN